MRFSRLRASRAWIAVETLLDQHSHANRILTLGIAAFVGAQCLIELPDLFRAFPIGIDFEIPLRAAARWAAGGQPYPAWAMLVQGGPDMPYLYPPFLLPVYALVAEAPRALATGLWLSAGVGAAVWSCRRLGIPWLAIPVVLAWPPFAEGLISGNVQIWSFAAFVALFYEPDGPSVAQRALVPARDVANGVLSAAVYVFKVTQALPALYLARRRPVAAAAGVGAIALLALAMLPLTGVGVYFDWLAQLTRASDPNWTIGGVGLGKLIGVPSTLLVAAAVAIALLARGRDSAAWLGIALLLAAPSIHGHAFLYLLPGIMTVRRDLSLLLAGMFVGVYHGFAWWLAVLMVAYLLVAGMRWARLRSDWALRAPIISADVAVPEGGAT